MTVYLASPASQQQAQAVCDMPVLISFGCWKPWMKRYQQTYKRVLVDSGAFSELTGAVTVEVEEYRAWSEQWLPHADAIAGLDDIRGDWKRSLSNYARIPWGFPTIHDSDPPELLGDLVAMACERNRWIGIGLQPPREGKERFIRWVCDNVPDSMHVHGWALRAYTHVRRVDSVDSTNWWRDAMAYAKEMPWLTYGECLEITVKRYVRWKRLLSEESTQMELTA